MAKVISDPRKVTTDRHAYCSLPLDGGRTARGSAKFEATSDACIFKQAENSRCHSFAGVERLKPILELFASFVRHQGISSGLLEASIKPVVATLGSQQLKTRFKSQGADVPCIKFSTPCDRISTSQLIIQP